MERLTIKNWRNLDPWETCGQDNYCKRGCHDQGGCTKGCIVPRIYDRLAAYEDTGLDPEEIKDNMEMFRAYRHICAGHEPEHIRDLLLAEKDGIPKCGTKVFALTTVGYWHKKYAKPEITECFVTTHRLAKNGETKFSVEGYLDSGSYYKAVFGKTSMGKTVFLTREEAEAALAWKGGVADG